MSQSPEEKIAKSGGKFLLGLLVYTFTTGIILAALAFWWAAHSFSTKGPLNETKLISIERGMGLNQIASLLENEGAIDNRYLFIFGTRLMGDASGLKAGEYQLEAGSSAKEIMIKLTEHDVFGRFVTIREGLTSFEVVRLLNGTENLSGEAKDLPAEGTLLPNTYSYTLNEDRNAVLIRMAQEMERTVLPLCGILLEASTGKDLAGMMDDACNSAPAPLKTVGDVLTLASIIEKETAVPTERAKVAGVFINRLRRNILLQTDPTVIYAINGGKHKNEGKGPLGRRLLRKDLKIDSPYNTYKYPGLPPGPIANPGEASIKAVFEPAEHDYIYFVADGTGGHAFAKTLAEHNRNVAQWRKIRRSQ